MGAASYIVLLLVAALLGVLLGWRRGLMGQTGSLLGVAFGIAGVRFLLPEFAPTVEEWLAKFSDVAYPEYFVASVGAIVIYFIFYLFFLLCGLILNRILKILAIQPLDAILGAIFGFFKWLMAVSVVYNAILGVNQSGPLYVLTGRGDGNPVEIVMELSPAVFGTPSPWELHHRVQLIEARSISKVEKTNKATLKDVSFIGQSKDKEHA